jgi:preprotein translocase subunit SecG
MILFSILNALFVMVCLLLIPLILVQKGKGSMGLGNVGGGAQMLFGGSGGQDVLQKATWVLSFIFMFGSLALAILKTREYNKARYLHNLKTAYQSPQETK